MTRDLVTVYIVNLIVDYANLTALRDLVYSFLLSKRNIKGAKKIHLMQTRKDRFTLSYIKDYAIYPREYRFFQRCLIVYYCATIPLYLLFIAVNLFFAKIALILIFVFMIIKIIIFLMIMTQFSCKISRFDKRYKTKR